jgi:hypothetical protein
MKQEGFLMCTLELIASAFDPSKLVEMNRSISELGVCPTSCCAEFLVIHVL